MANVGEDIRLFNRMVSCLNYKAILDEDFMRQRNMEEDGVHERILGSLLRRGLNGLL